MDAKCKSGIMKGIFRVWPMIYFYQYHSSILMSKWNTANVITWRYMCLEDEKTHLSLLTQIAQRDHMEP